jgi:hypothetical protein
MCVFSPKPLYILPQIQSEIVNNYFIQKVFTWVGDVVQVVEHLPSEHGTLNSNPSYTHTHTQKRKKEKRKRKQVKILSKVLET